MVLSRLLAIVVAVVLFVAGIFAGVSAPRNRVPVTPGPVIEETTASATTEAETTEAATTEAETTTEEQTTTEEPATEPATEEATEPATEEVTEPATEEVTEPATEEATEPATEAVTEPATEEVTEPATEEATEPATEEATEPLTEEVETEEAVYAEYYEDELVNFLYAPEYYTPERAIYDDPTAPQKSVAYDFGDMLLLVAQSDYAPKALLESLGEVTADEEAPEGEEWYTTAEGGLVRIAHSAGVYLCAYVKDYQDTPSSVTVKTAALAEGVSLEKLQTVISSLR